MFIGGTRQLKPQVGETLSVTYKGMTEGRDTSYHDYDEVGVAERPTELSQISSGRK